MKRIALITIISLTVVGVAAAAKKLSTAQSVKVKAPVETIWAIIIDANNWTKDNPAVAYSKLISGDGESVGSVIKFEPVVNGKKVKATLTLSISEKHKKIEYNVKIPSGSAIIGFDLAVEGDIVTVTSYESAEGFILNFIDQEGMDEEHRLWAEAIKRRAEAK